MSTPTTSATCGASAKATDPVPQPASSATSLPVNGPSRRRRRVGEIGGALLLEGEPEIDAHDPASSRASVARELEGVLARRDRPRCPLLVDGVEDTSDLGAGLDPQLVAAHERRRGIGATRSLHDSDELLRADERQRVERPWLRLTAEAVDCARRWVVGLPRAPECARVALELVRDGKPSEVLAEGDHESEVGIVERVEALVESAAERLEQADLVQAPVSRRGQSFAAPTARARRQVSSRTVPTRAGATPYARPSGTRARPRSAPRAGVEAGRRRRWCPSPPERRRPASRPDRRGGRTERPSRRSRRSR